MKASNTCQKMKLGEMKAENLKMEKSRLAIIEKEKATLKTFNENRKVDDQLA